MAVEQEAAIVGPVLVDPVRDSPPIGPCGGAQSAGAISNGIDKRAIF